MAANLNLFGSFLWAQRSSNGYSWGYLRPALNPTVTPVVNATANGIANFIKWTPYVSYQNNDGAPNTPDRDLGWEVTAGFEWMLLERYRLRWTSCLLAAGKMVQLRMRRPRGCRVESGDQDELITIPRSPFYPFGTNPDRVIDPIIGGEVALTVDF